jgi:hypothetical protein
MDSATLLRDQFKQVHKTLEGTVGDVTDEQARWQPTGKANPIGATYAHILISQDAMINGMLQHAAPLFAGEYAGRTGMSEMMPMPGNGGEELPSWSEWARNVQIDLPALRQYGRAVNAKTESYVAALSPEAVAAPLDLSGFGLGQQTLGWFLANIMLPEVSLHTGEISCLKGLQGAKGYPF